VTSITAQPDTSTLVRKALRLRAQAWIARLYRHEILTARTVRGMQLEAAQKFDEVVSRPLIELVSSRLSMFDQRGASISMDTIPELARLRDEIFAAAKNGTDAVRRLSTERLFDFTRAETEWVADVTKKTLRIAAARPTDAHVESVVESQPFLGDNTEQWFEKMVAGPTGERVKAWVQTGIQRGLTTDEVVRGLRGSRKTGYTDGIVTGQPRAAVQAVVRTAATHASNVARTESFKMLGVKTWRFVATLDSKTSIQCAANDGKTFPVGKGPIPPLHPNCRSTVVPDFGDPVGERASVDGPVPADVTFPEWLETQDRSVQDEVLGRTKANAWRNGQITIEQMLGRDLEPLTIAELRSMDILPPAEDE